MKDTAVRAERLVKDYCIYDHPAERLKELFLKKTRHRAFRALGPFDVEVHRGETLGIIGENGAGKSTFLKLVAGVTEPTSGKIVVEGKVSSILELGTGFNQEFTGRENVMLNGALHGFSPGEVGKRLGKIEEFADIGEFFDLPVKTYSSGMYLRLAFSLAVHVDADIVVIDEALAVGDGAYEKKCIDRIWDLKRRGVTLLYCSHSLYTVANFCDRAVWFRGGRAQEIGDTKTVISRYEDYLREKEQAEDKAWEVPQTTSERKITRVKDIRILAGGAWVENSLPYSSDVDVVVEFEIFEQAEVYVGFAVDRNDGICCYADTMHKQGMEPFRGPGSKKVTISFRRLLLLGGAYKFVAFLMDETGICIYDRRESHVVKVETDEKEWGICYLDHEWKR